MEARPGRIVRLIIALLPVIAACTAGSREASPRAVAEELLAADRAFSDSAAGDLLDGFARMFGDDVRLLAPGRWVQGRDAAIESLRANPVNVGARGAWTPIGAGISADGAHGFTWGHQTLLQPDTVRYARYVAYWIRGAAGWRVAAYKRIPTPPPPMNLVLRAPTLPERIVPARPAPDVLAGYEESLRSAEIAFSDDAVRRGIGVAFRAFGAPDAVNVGGARDTTFRFGPEEIAQGVEAGTRDVTLTWGPDEVLVAASGDLGVSMGYINITVEGSPLRRVPFLTVWRRPNHGVPWRYVAE